MQFKALLAGIGFTATLLSAFIDFIDLSFEFCWLSKLRIACHDSGSSWGLHSLETTLRILVFFRVQ